MTQSTTKRGHSWVFYVQLSIAILWIAAGSIKIVAFIRGAPILSIDDPVVSFFKLKYTATAAGCVEILIGAFTLFRRQSLKPMVASLWFLTVLVAYRILRRVFYAATPCPCLGGFMTWTGLSARVTELIPLAIIAYIAAAASTLLFFTSKIQLNSQTGQIDDSSQPKCF